MSADNSPVLSVASSVASPTPPTTCVEFCKGSGQDPKDILGWFKKFAPLKVARYREYDPDDLHTLLKSKAVEFDEMAKQQGDLKTAKKAWSTLTRSLEFTDELLESFNADLKPVTGALMGSKQSLIEGPDGGIETVPLLKINSPYLIKIVTEFLKQQRDDVISAKLESLQPKIKTKGTRVNLTDGEYELEFIGSDTDLQGSKHQYYLGEADKDKGFTKDMKVVTKGRDGQLPLKRKQWKAVRKAQPFIAMNTCSGCVNWDRAVGSDVLKSARISSTVFKACCSNTPKEGSDYCSKSGHDSDNNFWTGKYGSKTAVPGMSYAQFILQCDDNGGDTISDGDIDRAYCKSKGVKWIKD